MPSPDTDFSRTGVDRSTQLSVSPSFTLFPLVQHTRVGSMFLHDRNSMAIMSYEIEENISRSNQPSDVYIGFQRFSKFLFEEKRYRRLAEQGHAIFIFGMPDVSPPLIPGIFFISLTDDHALAREWFVIASTPEFYSALVAEELLELSSLDNIGPKGLFQGIWIFDPALISELVHQLRDELDLQLSLQSVHLLLDHQKQLNAIIELTNHLVSELEHRTQALDTQQKMHEELVNMLVHDLRGSLTSVIGSLEMLASGKVDQAADQRALIEISLENSRRLANMISNMLDINKREAGLLQFNRDLVNLHDLLASATARWIVTAGWSGKSIYTYINPELPLIIGDAGMLERVIDNLLSNAIKYGDAIRLSAGYSIKFVTISVIDNGPGIPASDREIVFEKFMQAHLGSAQRRGTGLGLAFCKMAVDAHGGTIQILDVEQNGTEFRMSLPVSPPYPKQAKKPTGKVKK